MRCFNGTSSGLEHHASKGRQPAPYATDSTYMKAYRRTDGLVSEVASPMMRRTNAAREAPLTQTWSKRFMAFNIINEQIVSMPLSWKLMTPNWASTVSLRPPDPQLTSLQSDPTIARCLERIFGRPQSLRWASTATPTRPEPIPYLSGPSQSVIYKYPLQSSAEAVASELCIVQRVLRSADPSWTAYML